MAKRKKTIIAGQIVKTIIYTAPEPLDGKRARAEKSKMTSAAQKAMNDKTARGRLEMLLAANFTGRDLFLTLTYRDADLPANRAAAVKLLRGFIKALRQHRKARGQDLKYIYTTEEKHGEARLHHHLVISSTGADMEVIRSLWPYADVIDMEYIGERDYVTKNLVTLKDLQAKACIMVWYAYSRDMKDLKASHIMLLPEQNDILTRGEFIQTLYEREDCPEATGKIGFSDVSQDMDVYAAIAWAAEQGFAGGYGNGSFGVNDPLSREQAVTILWRYSGSPMLMDYPGLTQYDDAGNISAFARKAMAWAHQKNLIDKQHKMLNPKENMMKDEAAEMLRDLIDVK